MIFDFKEQFLEFEQGSLHVEQIFLNFEQWLSLRRSSDILSVMLNFDRWILNCLLQIAFKFDRTVLTFEHTCRSLNRYL